MRHICVRFSKTVGEIDEITSRRNQRAIIKSKQLMENQHKIVKINSFKRILKRYWIAKASFERSSKKNKNAKLYAYGYRLFKSTICFLTV